MKTAPEKICVAPHQIFDNNLDTQSVGQNGAVEYVRKDIHDGVIEIAEDHAYFAGQEKFREKMLQWAKGEKMQSTTILADDWWQAVIEKIKSI